MMGMRSEVICQSIQSGGGGDISGVGFAVKEGNSLVVVESIVPYVQDPAVIRAGRFGFEGVGLRL